MTLITMNYVEISGHAHFLRRQITNDIPYARTCTQNSVSYRQTLRETLVKAGITNPLQWVFRLVGRFSILDGQKVYHISKSTLW